MRPEPAQPRLLHPLALLFALAVGGTAQAQTFRIQPTLNTQLTWTDNVDVADADPQQDWVLEVSPGVSMVRESGRLRGGLDLRLRSLNHVERTEENTTYLALNGRGSFEAIENSVFVDVDGSISRDNQSSFRGRLPGDALDYDEDNEVRVALNLGIAVSPNDGDTPEALEKNAAAARSQAAAIDLNRTTPSFMR